MAEKISAIDTRTIDLVREVTPGVISFYVDELSGIYLPEDYKTKFPEEYDVKYWDPKDRLRGKFGRFAVRQLAEKEDDEVPLADILIVGTTIPLSGDDRGRMNVLRHYTLNEKVAEVIDQRNLGEDILAEAVDYGSTNIKLDENGVPIELMIYDSSIDFGRADAEGRQSTCDAFVEVIGGSIEVKNSEPNPRESQKIIEYPF